MESRKKEITELALSLNIRPRVNWYRYQSIYKYAKLYLTQLSTESDLDKKLVIIDNLNNVINDYKSKKLPQYSSFRETRESLHEDIKALAIQNGIKCPGLTHHNIEKLKKIKQELTIITSNH